MIEFHETRVIAYFNYFTTFGISQILGIFWVLFVSIIGNNFTNKILTILFFQAAKINIFGKFGTFRRISISTHRKQNQAWWQSTIKEEISLTKKSTLLILFYLSFTTTKPFFLWILPRFIETNSPKFDKSSSITLLSFICNKCL